LYAKGLPRSGLRVVSMTRGPIFMVLMVLPRLVII
jgi:hypothetical protein